MAAPDPATTGDTLPRASSARLVVLVADDDADMRLYIRGCLRSRRDIHVVEASDGDEALALARVLHPDLVVSDRVMPGLSGDALRRALKADRRTRDIPFLLVSGERRPPPPALGGFLSKPFNGARLRETVDRLLGHDPTA